MKHWFWLLLFVACPAFGHHGWSNYDSSKTLKLTGTIEEIQYANPHATMKFKADGQEKPLEVILAPVSRMTDRGLPKDKLKKGDKVTIEGYQHKKEQNEIRAERIIVGDKTVELR